MSREGIEKATPEVEATNLARNLVQKHTRVTRAHAHEIVKQYNADQVNRVLACTSQVDPQEKNADDKVAALVRVAVAENAAELATAAAKAAREDLQAASSDDGRDAAAGDAPESIEQVESEAGDNAGTPANGSGGKPPKRARKPKPVEVPAAE